MTPIRRFGPILPALVLLLGACSSGSPVSSTGVGVPGASLAGPGQVTAAPLATLPAGGGGGGNAGGVVMPCEKLAPVVTQVSGLFIAGTDFRPDDCSFTVDAVGDSSSAGLGGIIDIRVESAGPEDFDSVIKLLIGPTGVEVPGVGDRALMSSDGSLMYASHNGHIWAVQQELLMSGVDLAGNAKKYFAALFQSV